MTTNTTELNERLARLLGFDPDDRGYLVGHGTDIGNIANFNPATSKDDFDKHVLPRLKELGLMEEWAEKVHRLTRYTQLIRYTSDDYIHDYAGIAELISAPAHVLAEAACVVLERHAAKGG